MHILCLSRKLIDGYPTGTLLWRMSTYLQLICIDVSHNNLETAKLLRYANTSDKHIDKVFLQIMSPIIPNIELTMESAFQPLGSVHHRISYMQPGSEQNPAAWPYIDCQFVEKGDFPL